MLARLLIPALALSLLVFVLHIKAMEFSFYWVYWWFDILIHTLTGVALGLLLFFLFSRLFSQASFSTITHFTLLVVLSIAILWEVFELVNGLAHAPERYAIDTAMDICVALVGALASCYYGRLISRSNNNDNKRHE